MSGRDDTLTVKFLSLTSSPMAVVGELPIKLARKCVQAVGSSILEEDAQDRTQVAQSLSGSILDNHPELCRTLVRIS